MRDLEESTLTSLQDTTIASASRYATVVIALRRRRLAVRAAALIAVIPFLFVGALGINGAFYAAMGVALVELFGLGAFLGRISRDRLWLSGIKLMVAGLVALGLGLLLGGGVK